MDTAAGLPGPNLGPTISWLVILSKLLNLYL